MFKLKEKMLMGEITKDFPLLRDMAAFEFKMENNEYTSLLLGKVFSY